VLRRIFGPKRKEITGNGRKCHSDQHISFYSFPDIIRAIISIWVRWAGSIACIRTDKFIKKVLWET
jgi:hypothetical protein